MAKDDKHAAQPGSHTGLPIWLELTLMQSGGWIGRAGQQSMVGRFCCQSTSSGERTDATVNILARDHAGSWQSYERTVALDCAKDIAASVQGLGMPARKPAVEPVMDTSNTWTHLWLRVQANDQTTQLDLPMQCSGFAGDDAEALRHLCRVVFSAAGYADFDRSLFGEPSELAPGEDRPSDDRLTRAATPRCCSHCGHDVGAAGYATDTEPRCLNSDCGQQLLRLDATCVQMHCGHLAPIGAKYCWCCGAATVVG